jgi:signal transduction histidine kinase
VDVKVGELLKEIIDLNVDKKVKCMLPDDLPTVRFDRSKLGQIFSNLISNAVKYNDKEEPILEIGYADHATKHQFTVKDNGPGIEKDYHDRIFGIFQTLHTKDEIESTGIGLSIVKKIVDDAGGIISVESEKGGGSKFIFTLPKQ